MKAVGLIRSLFWRSYLRLKGAKVGSNMKVGGPFNIVLRDSASLSNLIIGNNVTFDGITYIRMRRQSRIILNNNVRIGTEVWLVAANDREFIIGEKTGIGNYSILNGGHGLKIGKGCALAGFVYIHTSGWVLTRAKTLAKSEVMGTPVEIGDDVWVGGHVSITPGVTIGTGSVIGMGSVVTKNIAEYQIVAGNPVRVIRERI
jgi:acetyltransferase-like isoleucine patch superfamily enzyme